jgi:predicted GNAT family acetyltransferase
MSSNATGDTDVVDNVDLHRYELYRSSELVGQATYSPIDGGLRFTHTEIDPALQRQGLAGRLIQAALDDVRTRGLTAVPVCSFVADFIAHHPEYLDLVPDGERAHPEIT